MSSNLCDKFIKDSIKIYLSHDIYDAPLVTYDKEQKLCERFSQYDIIFLSSKNLSILTALSNTMSAVVL